MFFKKMMAFKKNMVTFSKNATAFEAKRGRVLKKRHVIFFYHSNTLLNIEIY